MSRAAMSSTVRLRNFHTRRNCGGIPAARSPRVGVAPGAGRGRGALGLGRAGETGVTGESDEADEAPGVDAGPREVPSTGSPIGPPHCSDRAIVHHQVTARDPRCRAEPVDHTFGVARRQDAGPCRGRTAESPSRHRHCTWAGIGTASEAVERLSDSPGWPPRPPVPPVARWTDARAARRPSAASSTGTDHIREHRRTEPHNTRDRSRSCHTSAPLSAPAPPADPADPQARSPPAHSAGLTQAGSPPKRSTSRA